MTHRMTMPSMASSTATRNLRFLFTLTIIALAPTATPVSSLSPSFPPSIAVQSGASPSPSTSPAQTDTLTTVTVVSENPKPLLSFVDGTSSFAQVSRPTFVVASDWTGGISGLLVSSQNCTTATAGGPCVACNGTGPKANVVAFSKLVSGGGATSQPVLQPITDESVVFKPNNGTMDDRGVQSPRITYDPWTDGGMYFMFYTAYGSGNGTDYSVLLALASSKNPSLSDGWTMHGPVFPGLQGIGHGSMLAAPFRNGFYTLFYGDREIYTCSSMSPTNWDVSGCQLFLTPRFTSFDSKLVQVGPPPLLLSDGKNYIVFYNSANITGAYQPGWLISTNDFVTLSARSSVPLLTPTQAWQTGSAPYTCSVENSVYLDAAVVTEVPDVFRVYFSGAGSAVGTAVVKVILGQGGADVPKVEVMSIDSSVAPRA